MKSLIEKQFQKSLMNPYNLSKYQDKIESIVCSANSVLEFLDDNLPEKSTQLKLTVALLEVEIEYILGDYLKAKDRLNTLLSLELKPELKKICNEQVGMIAYNIGSALSKQRIGKTLEFFEISLGVSEKLYDGERNERNEGMVVKRTLAVCQLYWKNHQFDMVVDMVLKMVTKLPIDVIPLENLIMLYVPACLKCGSYVTIPSRLSRIDQVGLSEDDILKILDYELHNLEQINDCTKVKIDVINQILQFEKSILKKAELMIRLSGLLRSIGENAIETLDELFLMLEIGESKELKNVSAKAYCEKAIVGMEKSQPDQSLLFHKAFDLWNEIFDQPISVKSDDLYQYLVFLLALFNKHGYQLLKIRLLGIMLKACGSNSKDLLEIHIYLAETYLELGFSGRAALALGSAKSYLDKIPDYQRVRFYIVYSRYLLAIGNIEKSIDFRGKITKDAEGKLDKIESSDLKALDSQIALVSGSSQLALEYALSGYRILAQLLKQAQRSKSDELYPDFITNLFASLVFLSDAYFYLGNSGPMNYYLKLGTELSENYDCYSFQAMFSVKLAYLSRKKELFQDGNGFIENAKSLSNLVKVF
jgi:hypothetical protein